ncbi:hypothetical protein CDCA_CDCA17G4429 [Cyanidium caldarium]|uniref:Uncharacterized protein n=1 Tax=Cyanidium caldarium TaxID=2771 RepID=A0AAV9J1H9_CYACA|nr:hypothetical protein CDCA_CDCA17G4429 [Cyanidium caldarium]
MTYRSPPPRYRGSPARHFDKENLFRSPNHLNKMNQSIQTPFKELANSPSKLEDQAYMRKRIEEETYKAKQLKMLNSTLILRLKETTAEWEASKRLCSEAEARIIELRHKTEALEACLHDKDVDLVSVSKELARQQKANEELRQHAHELDELRIEVLALRESKHKLLADMEGLQYEKDHEVQHWRALAEQARTADSDEMVQLRQKVSSLRAEQEEVRRELQLVTEKKDAIAQTLDRVFAETRTYRNACQTKDQQYASVCAENTELKRKREELLRDIDALKRQIEALTQELDDTHQRSTLLYKLKSLLSGLLSLFGGSA